MATSYIPNGYTYLPTVMFKEDQTSLMALASDGHVYVFADASNNKSIRLGFTSITSTSGGISALQVKPAITVARTADGLTALEVSPRVNSGIAMAGASGTVIGVHSDVYLKGTATGTIAGDVRSTNLELVTDDAGTRTISGNVNFIRMRAAFSATTISGKFCPIRIEKAEAQTNSKQYDALLDLPSTNGAGASAVWHDTQNTSTTSGVIKVLVNGNVRWIQLYSTTPS